MFEYGGPAFGVDTRARLCSVIPHRESPRDTVPLLSRALAPIRLEQIQLNNVFFNNDSADWHIQITLNLGHRSNHHDSVKLYISLYRVFYPLLKTKHFQQDTQILGLAKKIVISANNPRRTHIQGIHSNVELVHL